MDNIKLLNLQELASTGNISAIVSLIDFYKENGDYSKAFLTAQWFIYFPSGVGYRYLAEFYLKGIGTIKNIDKAVEYYQKGFELGDYDSGYQLSLYHIKNKDFSSALKYLFVGIENNHIPSIKLLANMYINGDGVSKDAQIAINLLNKAKELGDIKVIHQLALLYYSFEEYNKAFECFKKGADNGDLDSVYHLGLCYAKGLGVRQDFYLARAEYEKAAKEYEPRSLYNLSLYYRNGISVNQNSELADRLLEQAYEHGFKK